MWNQKLPSMLSSPSFSPFIMQTLRMTVIIAITCKKYPYQWPCHHCHHSSHFHIFKIVFIVLKNFANYSGDHHHQIITIDTTVITVITVVIIIIMSKILFSVGPRERDPVLIERSNLVNISKLVVKEVWLLWFDYDDYDYISEVITYKYILSYDKNIL